MNMLVKGTKSVARIARNLEPEWIELLEICRDRLTELLPLCNDTDTIVRAVNCMAQIADLIATADHDDDETLSTAITEKSAVRQTTHTPVKQPSDRKPSAEMSAIEDTKKRMAAINDRINKMNAGKY